MKQTMNTGSVIGGIFLTAVIFFNIYLMIVQNALISNLLSAAAIVLLLIIVIPFWVLMVKHFFKS